MMGAEKRAAILPVVIMALAVVALLRAANVWVGFSSAEAQTAGADRVDTIVVASAMEAPSPAVAETPSAVERRLLAQLASRREALDQRERDLDTREALLNAAETRLTERFATLESEIETLNALLAKKEQAEQAEFDALSDAYERMKPREAARIFEVLEDDILVPVAAGMRTQAIAGVLAEMNPNKARRLTRLLAQNGVDAGADQP
ncbi:MAG: hypothetical protein AAGJ73_08410 [Pseudomonadota bacterium]